jgi:hypothetical protein
MSEIITAKMARSYYNIATHLRLEALRARINSYILEAISEGRTRCCLCNFGSVEQAYVEQVEFELKRDKYSVWWNSSHDELTIEWASNGELGV